MGQRPLWELDSHLVQGSKVKGSSTVYVQASVSFGSELGLGFRCLFKFGWDHVSVPASTEGLGLGVSSNPRSRFGVTGQGYGPASRGQSPGLRFQVLSCGSVWCQVLVSDLDSGEVFVSVFRSGAKGQVSIWEKCTGGKGQKQGHPKAFSSGRDRLHAGLWVSADATFELHTFLRGHTTRVASTSRPEASNT